MGSPQLIQEGFLPTSRAGNPLRLIVLAVLCGLVLGVGLALLREQADRRLHRAEDVSAAFDARVLTTVPRHRSLKRRVPFDDLPPDVAEAFRMLFINLRYAPGGRPRTILVTSSHSEDGKTTVAWYLASAAAAGGLSVALVEADMRRPRIAERYGLSPSPGWRRSSAAASRSRTRSRASRPATAETTATSPTPRRSACRRWWPAPRRPIPGCSCSPASWTGRSGAAQRHDLVVVDTPPIPYVADAVSLLGSVDGVIVVASMSSTKGPEAARLRDQLADLRRPCARSGGQSRVRGARVHLRAHPRGRQRQRRRRGLRAVGVAAPLGLSQVQAARSVAPSRRLDAPAAARVGLGTVLGAGSTPAAGSALPPARTPDRRAGPASAGRACARRCCG